MKNKMLATDWLKSHTENEYRTKEIEKAQTIVNALKPFVNAELFIHYSVEDGKMYYEYPMVYFTIDGLEFRCNYDWGKKKQYGFHLPAIQQLQNIDWRNVNELKKNLTEPNGVGVLSLPKIMAWVDYYKTLYQNCVAFSEAKQTEKEAFLKSIEGLDVDWWENGKKGEIVRNGVRFTFNIETDYISKKIDLHYSVDSSLDTFLKLSDNKFTSK